MLSNKIPQKINSNKGELDIIKVITCSGKIFPNKFPLFLCR